MNQQIKIGANVWTIEEVENNFSLNPVMAECQNITQRIIIDKNLPETMKEQVLMHELLHAVGFTMDDERLKTDEAYVNTLSHFLVQINNQIYKNKVIYNSEGILK